MINNLKPCPFCGGSAYIKLVPWDIFITGAEVRCSKCGARTELIQPSPDYTAKDKAAELWNRRVQIREVVIKGDKIQEEGEDND